MNDYNYNGYDNSNYNENYQNNYYAPADEISDEKFNLIIGAVLIYGFLINCIMTACFGKSITLFVAEHPAGFYISYLILAIVGVLMIRKSDNPVISFIGYNFMVVPLGMVLAATLTIYSMAGYSTTITYAFAITAGVTLLMMVAANIFPSFFLSIGRTLGVTLLLTIVIELIMMLIGASLGIIDYIVVLVFCGYVGYDWAKANKLPKTVDNAVDSAAELYIDIVNLFLRILRILARANRR